MIVIRIVICLLIYVVIWSYKRYMNKVNDRLFKENFLRKAVTNRNVDFKEDRAEGFVKERELDIRVNLVYKDEGEELITDLRDKAFAIVTNVDEDNSIIFIYVVFYF